MSDRLELGVVYPYRSVETEQLGDSYADGCKGERRTEPGEERPFWFQLVS